MKRALLPILALVLALTLTLTMASPVAAANYQTIPLIAGQDEEIGYVEVSNDTANLYFRFVITEPGWEVIESHIAFDTDPDNIPQTGSGNPKVGHFPYSDNDGVYAPIAIPSAWTLPTTIFIAAHAVVRYTDPCDPCIVREETAWGMGETCQGQDSIPFGGNSWAEYFPYLVQ